MSVIIDGHKIAEKIKNDTVRGVMELNGSQDGLRSWSKADQRPNLAIVLVGEKEDSLLYVNLKEKEAKKVGIDTHLYKIPKHAGDDEVVKVIQHLNSDEKIDAILVQLPLPQEYDVDRIINSIDPRKDLDRFHPENQKQLLDSCDHDHIMPPVFEVVFVILKEINQEVKDKNICIFSDSEVFGPALARVLKCRGGRAEVCGSQNKNSSKKTLRADIIITAIGSPHFLKKDMIKDGATVIDIGIKKQGRKVYGDVDFDNVKEKAGFLTPVPGGVGPITIAIALKNTLELYKKRKAKNRS